MDPAQIVSELREYIVRDVLDGAGDDIDGQTPLLELGILNSLQIVRLIAVIDKRFGVSIDLKDVVGEHFRNLDSIAALVVATGQAD